MWFKISWKKVQKTKKKEVYFDEKKMVGHAHIGTVPLPKNQRTLHEGHNHG